MNDLAETGPLILGASGQVGQMFYRLWARGDLDFGAPPVWQVRRHVSDLKQTLYWDILGEPIPAIRPSAVICLAGGPGTDRNAEIAEVALAAAQGAPLLYASTQAVYGVQKGVMSETTSCAPNGDYGRQKLAAEEVLANHSNATALRIGNVVGADSLSRSITQGPVALDQFPDGRGPRRMMIGPKSLGQALSDLLLRDRIAEPVLNLAQPGLVAMADMLDAARAEWHWQPAPKTAIPALELELTAVRRYIDIPSASPDQLLSEAHLAGWSANA